MSRLFFMVAWGLVQSHVLCPSVELKTLSVAADLADLADIAISADIVCIEGRSSTRGYPSLL